MSVNFSFGIVGILLLWAWLFGIPTTWGRFNIDIFPPKIELIK